MVAYAGRINNGLVLTGPALPNYEFILELCRMDVEQYLLSNLLNNMLNFQTEQS